MSEKVDCLIVDDEPVARDILQNHLAGIESINVVASCRSAIEAFNIINKRRVDLIFLDINMPEISGLSFARSLNKDIKIIFTTAYREYAVDGFDLQAVDYLLKPISFERLLQSVNKYLEEKPKFKESLKASPVFDKQDFFFVRSDRKMIKISYDDILFIESVSDYIRIHLREKSVTTRETIANIEVKLPQNSFLRTHRSFVVAIANISSFTNEYVEVADKQIPISRSYKSIVLKKLEGD